MQKVTAILPSWDKTKTSSKTGFDKGWKLLGKWRRRAVRADAVQMCNGQTLMAGR